MVSLQSLHVAIRINSFHYMEPQRATSRRFCSGSPKEVTGSPYGLQTHGSMNLKDRAAAIDELLDSTPIPTWGITTRTTASIFTFLFSCMSVPRTPAWISRVQRAHTKHPPSERSEVTPLARLPDSNSSISTSAAKG